MNKYILIALCLLLANQLNALDSSDKQEIRKAFDEYRDAAFYLDKKKILEVSSKRVFERYEKYRDLALSGVKEELVKLPVMERYIVLRIRLLTEKEELEKMNGRQLFEYAVKYGLIGSADLLVSELESVEVDGDFSVGVIYNKKRDRRVKMEFHKENLSWKIDPISVIAYFDNGIINEHFGESSDPEAEFLKVIIRMNTSVEIPDDVYAIE